MLIYVDIDETICTSPEDRNYENAVPLKERIIKINKLYDQGNTIVYWTARGTGSGIDWREVTENQFEKWGVKYHELHLNKPVYDLFIDDKNINADTYFKNIELEII
tara:strand:+ start:140 stop:457 length:318 start_codon:yes stop_codon:yes gene_type:complete